MLLFGEKNLNGKKRDYLYVFECYERLTICLHSTRFWTHRQTVPKEARTKLRTILSDVDVDM